jgi:hypothetical protein
LGDSILRTDYRHRAKQVPGIDLIFSHRSSIVRRYL